MAYPYIIQGSNITVVIGTTSHTINTSHIAYDRIKEAIKSNDWEAVKDLIEPRKLVIKYGAGNVQIDGETFLWKGKPMHNALSVKMIDMLKEGFSIDPLVLFLENLQKNPSKRAVDELYGFLEKGNLPITPDGYFLAYKKVRDNFTDCHTGTMDNSVGKVVEMERNEVDDDKDRTCSNGLHFCSRSYLAHFGGARTVILKINPADVVSIPSDYNDAKGRACRYEVIGELNVDPEQAFTRSVQTTAVGSSNHTGPKQGNGEFSRGYRDGFYNYRNLQAGGAYNEGFAKGQHDRFANIAERYAYVGDVAPEAKWPFATAPDVAPTVTSAVRQDYDRNGNPLSMTKDAIRKREARAKVKAAQSQASTLTPPATSGFWPKPKGF